MLNNQVDREIESLPKVNGGEPYLSREANDALQKAIDYSNKLGDQFVALEAMLMGLFLVKSPASAFMKDAGITEKELGAAIDELRKGEESNRSFGRRHLQCIEQICNQFERTCP